MTLAEAIEKVKDLSADYDSVCNFDFPAILAALEEAKAVIEKLIAARAACDALDDAIETRSPEECDAAHEQKESAGLALDAALNAYEKGKS